MSQEKKTAHKQGLIRLAVCVGIKLVILLLMKMGTGPLPTIIKSTWPFFFGPIFFVLTLGMVWGLVELVSGRRVSELAARLGS